MTLLHIFRGSRPTQPQNLPSTPHACWVCLETAVRAALDSKIRPRLSSFAWPQCGRTFPVLVSPLLTMSRRHRRLRSRRAERGGGSATRRRAAAATQRLRKVLTVTWCRCVHANTSSPDAFSRRIDTANPFASADAAEDTKWRVMELNY